MCLNFQSIGTAFTQPYDLSALQLCTVKDADLELGLSTCQLMTNNAIQVGNANPVKALILTKSESQLLQTYTSQSWEHAYRSITQTSEIKFHHK